MAIRYVSPHDSPEDPGGLIREVLELGATFQGPAEDLLLSWTLRLGDDVAPAAAARTLLARYGIADGPPAAGAAGRLVALLRQTAESGPVATGRRRGGWRGRRS